jgi:hypothetical protein
MQRTPRSGRIRRFGMDANRRILLPMSDSLDQLRAATEALGNGDPEPFVPLIADDCEWRGAPRGHLWWKRTPS